MSDIQQYGGFIKEIKELIYRRQYEAMKAVNKELLQLYWEIGEEINNQQIDKGWGKSIVEILAKELQKEFPGVKGFSAANLWRMRNFYLAYSKNEKLQPLVAEITAKPSLKPPLSVIHCNIKLLKITDGFLCFSLDFIFIIVYNRDISFMIC